MDGFGGDVEFAGDVVEFQDGVTGSASVFDFYGEGVGEEFDEAGEIGPEDFA